jgi:superfamily II DNA/RNA helicase
LSFSDFNLQADFIKSIEAAGYQSPTPLQSQLIPLLAEKKSVIVSTQSASGKTGAFLIPAMNYILENPAPEKRGARVLILTSRRDRVSQINYTIKRLSQDHTMRFGFIVSGRPYQTQMRLMRRPLDIMIATPGRLNDLMSNGKADFSQLEMLIIDDLTAIYKKNLHGLVEQIINQADENCSTLTFISHDDETSEYAESLFPDAVNITMDDNNNQQKEQQNKVAKHMPEQQHTQQHSEKVPPPEPKNTITVPDNLTPQKVHIADDYTHKIAMMDHLMDEFSGEPTLIYTATNKAAKTLQDNLSNHGHAAELVDEIDASELKDIDILINSDQQKTVLEADAYSQFDKHIIHFDLPRKTEQYLKRLTNHQQNADNEILLMVDGYNFNELKHIEKTLGESLSQIIVPGLEPLNPFVNLSRGKPSHNKSRPNQNKAGQRKPNNRNANQKNGRANNKQKNNPRNAKANNPRNSSNKNTNQNSTDENQTDAQRRQRKGPFGRLNGGAQRKKSGGRDNNNTQGQGQSRNNNNRRNVKVGVSTRGTAPPPGSTTRDRDWKAAPQERKVEQSKPVVIRYSKKRILEDKPEDKDS